MMNLKPISLFVTTIGVSSTLTYYMNSNSQKILKCHEQIMEKEQSNIKNIYELQMTNLRLLEEKINSKSYWIFRLL